MIAVHLVMPPAHFLRDGGPFAILAGAPYLLPAPSVFRRTMPSDTFIVHKAKPIGRVLSTTLINFAKSHGRDDSSYPSVCKYKALGNAWAVACVRPIALGIMRGLAA